MRGKRTKYFICQQDLIINIILFIYTIHEVQHLSTQQKEKYNKQDHAFPDFESVCQSVSVTFISSLPASEFPCSLENLCEPCVTNSCKIN